jgi:drug/metabolite transporter (DMT)-like permease
MKESRRIPRRIGAVLAGVLTGVVLSLGTDMALRAAGIFPPLGQPMSDALFLLAAAHRTVYGIAGSYITARLAPDRPMTHALVLGVAGLLVSILGVVTTWDRGPEFGPKWYPLSLVATAIPCAWAGGRLRVSQLTTAPPR